MDDRVPSPPGPLRDGVDYQMRRGWFAELGAGAAEVHLDNAVALEEQVRARHRVVGVGDRNERLVHRGEPGEVLVAEVVGLGRAEALQGVAVHGRELATRWPAGDISTRNPRLARLMAFVCPLLMAAQARWAGSARSMDTVRPLSAGGCRVSC